MAAWLSLGCKIHLDTVPGWRGGSARAKLFRRPPERAPPDLLSAGVNRERKARSHKQRKYMKTLRNIIHLAFALIAFAFLGLTASVRAVSPPPDVGHPGGNTAEEDNVLPDLSAETESGAMGHAANDPNHRVIHINFTRLIPRPCGLEIVELRGQLHLSFALVEIQGQRVVMPTNIKVEAFSGTGKSIGRKYEAGRVHFLPVKTTKLNGLGAGEFRLRIQVTGHPKSQGDPNPSKVVRFRLVYKVVYDWGPDNKVTRLAPAPGDPEIFCGHE